MHLPAHARSLLAHAPFLCLHAHAELLLVPACTYANLPQKQLIEPDSAPYLLLWCCNACETVLLPNAWKRVCDLPCQREEQWLFSRPQ